MLLGIHTDKIQFIISVWTKYFLYFVPLVLSEEAVVYKHTCQLVTNSFREKDCCHRTVYTTGQGTENTSISHFISDCLNLLFHKRIHAPVSGTAAYAVYEIR